jgi:hypothetical protein
MASQTLLMYSPKQAPASMTMRTNSIYPPVCCSLTVVTESKRSASEQTKLVPGFQDSFTVGYHVVVTSTIMNEERKTQRKLALVTVIPHFYVLAWYDDDVQSIALMTMPTSVPFPPVSVLSSPPPRRAASGNAQ